MTIRMDYLPKDLFYEGAETGHGVFVADWEDAAAVVAARGHPRSTGERRPQPFPWRPSRDEAPCEWPVPPPPLPVAYPIVAKRRPLAPVTVTSGDVALLTADRSVTTSLAALYARMQVIMSRDRRWDQNMADVVVLLSGLPVAAVTGLGAGELDAELLRAYYGKLEDIQQLLHDYSPMRYSDALVLRRHAGLHAAEAVRQWAVMQALHLARRGERDSLRLFGARVLFPGMAKRGQDILWARLWTSQIEDMHNITDDPEASEEARRAAEAMAAALAGDEGGEPDADAPPEAEA